jgi:GAF domain-containing protein
MDQRESGQQELRTLHRYAHTIANASTALEIFHAAEQAAQELIGHQLFTIMSLDSERMEVERCFSSNPGIYPAGGRKKKRDTAWGRHVLEGGQVFIGEGEASIRKYFADHTVITGLGLRAVLNIPVKRRGEVIGTINLLDRTAHYTASDGKTGGVIAMGLTEVLSL